MNDGMSGVKTAGRMDGGDDAGFSIASISINGSTGNIVTDSQPRISFELSSDAGGESLHHASIHIDGHSWTTNDQINNVYDKPLRPFARYDVLVEATSSRGRTAQARTWFETGRRESPWEGRWITDMGYSFPDGESPVPMVFRKRFALKDKAISRAWVNSTALGIYELSIDGERVGQDYFAPGHTSYWHEMQYQTYDVTRGLLSADRSHEITAVVAGGWAVGEFTYHRKSKIYADRQALLCEIHVEYADGDVQIVVSDTSWDVSEEGPYRSAQWYDGETYDSTVDLNEIEWRRADELGWRKNPTIMAQYGEPVRAHERFTSVHRFTAKSGEVVYDFGQNFAGVIEARIRGVRGRTIVFRHAEVLVDGELFVKSLRTAKASATYICSDGEQTYSPRLTYMGFRYVGVTGIDAEDIELSAHALYSTIGSNASFECSNPDLNRLQENIRWGGKSNFVDIPTDCPQRDEREGWTGDIAVFAKTACFNFDMGRFLDKWLLDMKSEQGRGGGIPMVVPRSGDSWPVMATSCWGDSAIVVPWAEYLARGDRRMLERQYPVMKKFLHAAAWWSGLFSVRPSRRKIWRFPFHFGDWTAPDENVKQWLAKGKWIATAYYANSAALVSRIAQELGHDEEAVRYGHLHDDITRAFRTAFTDGNGRLRREFQTGYVLPLYFEMTTGRETANMADRLNELVVGNGYHIATGFTGTPYILFALSDNGHADTAYDLLLQEDCPSWLYEVKAGGTTIWERWDALRPDGTVNMDDLQSGESAEESNGGMVSFNHYASGAVGDWLYRRVAGIEPTGPGYRTFTVRPLVGGGLSYARASVHTPYGRASSDWHVGQGEFDLTVEVPVSTTCTVCMPDGTTHAVASGTHRFRCSCADRRVDDDGQGRPIELRHAREPLAIREREPLRENMKENQ